MPRNKKWSGRLDLNQRLLGPEPSALAKLSHAPTVEAHFIALSQRHKKQMAKRSFPHVRVIRDGCEVGDLTAGVILHLLVRFEHAVFFPSLLLGDDLLPSCSPPFDGFCCALWCDGLPTASRASKRGNGNNNGGASAVAAECYSLPDDRNLRHQKRCVKPECRHASKVARQAKWRLSPKGYDYFPTDVPFSWSMYLSRSSWIINVFSYFPAASFGWLHESLCKATPAEKAPAPNRSVVAASGGVEESDGSVLGL
jgi:hypothetical protein